MMVSDIQTDLYAIQFAHDKVTDNPQGQSKIPDNVANSFIIDICSNVNL